MSKRTTITLQDKCTWKQRWDGGLSKWEIECTNSITERQAYHDEHTVCGACKRPVYYVMARP